MNLLIVSPGRRVEIVNYFKEEIHKLGGKVFTADMSEYAPALYSGDEYFILKKDFNNLDVYIESIIQLCIKNNIYNLITLIDPELKLFSENIDKFNNNNINVIISDKDIVQDTFDKLKFYEKYKEKISLVNTWGNYNEVAKKVKSNQLQFPLFCKDRYGSGSSGINKISSIEELEKYKNDEEKIFQEYIEGQEYGVDVYIDMISNQIVSIFIKHKLGMRAGETDKAISIYSEDIIKEVIKIQNIKGLRGPIDVDVFRDKNGKLFINEINPRFGGGYPHAYNCGINFISMMVNNLRNIENQKNIGKYKNNVIMMKYNGLVFRE